MPRYASLIAPIVNTDVGIRAAVAGIKAGIEAIGFVQTADTGQLDPTTITAFTGGSQSRGFLLWRMNDALSGTNPAILKIEFKSNSATQMRLAISFGILTTGAGLFTGIYNFFYTEINCPGGLTTPLECYFSGDTNRIVVSLWDNCSWYQTADNCNFFWMERLHDTTGADTNAGIWCGINTGGSNIAGNKVIPYSGNLPHTLSQLLGFSPTSNASLLNNTIGLFPIFPYFVTAMNPSTQILSYLNEVSGNTILSVDQYGATHQYLTTRSIRGPNNGWTLAMRWDP